MAEAIVSALRDKGVQDMSKVTVFDVNEGRLQRFKSVYNTNISTSLNNGLDNAEIVSSFS